MNKVELFKRLQDIEWEDFEVKEAYEKLPKNIWETVSAFSNTAGGWIVLGVKQIKNKFDITGVRNPEKIEQAFTTVIRGEKFNTKISCNCKRLKIEDKTVLLFYIPLSEKKPVYFNTQANTYIRTGSGDQKATKEEIDAMYRDQAFGTLTNKTVPASDSTWIDYPSFNQYREYIKRNNPEHIYNKLSDEEFLNKLRIIIDNKLSLGGLLFLGINDKIQSVITDFRIDYFEIPGISYSDAEVRYTFRLAELENLWQYYFAIFNRLSRQIDLPFKIQSDGTSSTNYLYLEAIREALVNLLQHSDYFSKMKPRIRSFYDRIEFLNPGNLPKPLEQLIKEDISLPRNGIISKLFRVANLSENGGYGFDKMNKGWRSYNNTLPVYTNDISFFKVVFNTTKQRKSSAHRESISYGKNVLIHNSDSNGGQRGGQRGGQILLLNTLTARQMQVLKLIAANPSITRKELSQYLGINESAVQKHFTTLKNKGIIARVGKTSDSNWVLLFDAALLK